MVGFVLRCLVGESLRRWVPAVGRPHQAVATVAWIASVFVLAQVVPNFQPFLQKGKKNLSLSLHKSYSGTLASMFAVPDFHIRLNRQIFGRIFIRMCNCLHLNLRQLLQPGGPGVPGRPPLGHRGRQPHGGRRQGLTDRQPSKVCMIPRTSS